MRGTACPPTMVSPYGAAASTDCTCPANQYYSGATCVACPKGSWCPNGWSSLPCPGNADPVNSVTLDDPGGCVCAAGATGAACTPCPAGFYCPSSGAGSSSSAVATAVNNVVVLTLAPRSSSDVCPAMAAALAPQFASGTRLIAYLQSPATLAPRLFCQTVPAPLGRTSIQPLAVIMVQTDSGDASNSVITGLTAFLASNATAAALGATVLGVWPAYAPDPTKVPNNVPTVCPTGKAPNPSTLADCVCAPGFASTSSGACTPCPLAMFKVGLGAGNCLSCPIGTTTTAAGASACALLGGGGSKTNTTGTAGGAGTASNMNTIIIVAGVAGGVLVVGALIFLVVTSSS